MCVISNVMDHYNPLFPAPTPLPVDGPGVHDFDWTKFFQPPIDLVELRKLVDEFKEAVAAAKKLDIILKQPDCIDPEKAKLEERVAALEARLAEIDAWRGR
jgi:hypothetical protein